MAKTTTTKKANTTSNKTTTAKCSAKDILSELKKKYDEVYDDGSIYTIKKGGKWGFVSKDGKELIKPTFSGLGEKFVEDIIITFNGSKGIGFVNKQGKEIVKSKYNSSRNFSNGFAAICLNGKWGFVDKTGKETVKPTYDAVENFKGSKAKVTLKGKSFYIDTKGKIIEEKKTTAAITKRATSAEVKTTEISVTGNKKIDTLRKEFNKKFPYLRLGIFYSYARQQVAKGESITPIPGDKTLASVRRANSGGDISISGNKKIKSLEKEFDTVFGLYCQVCYTEDDGHRYYTSGSTDEKTLATFNAECEKNGCKKGDWK